MKIDLNTIEKIQNGSTSSFDKDLYKQIKRIVSLNVYKFSNSNPVIKINQEDFIQDVIIKVYEKIHTYKPNFEFETWVSKITKNHMIDFTRKKTVFKMVDDSIKSSCNRSHDGEDVNYEDIFVDDSNNEKENQDHNCIILNEIIKHSKFKPIEIEILKMRFIKEMMYEQIAEELMIPIGTAKVTINRIKKKLLMSSKKLNIIYER